MTSDQEKYMRLAIATAHRGMEAGKGGPFGCVIVKDGQVIAAAHNEVTSSNDPTAHAEIVAIRAACHELQDFQLTGCELYASCEPCPMCLGAIYWARPSVVYYAADKADAARAHFDDAFIYDEIDKAPSSREIRFVRLPLAGAADVFDAWLEKQDRQHY